MKTNTLTRKLMPVFMVIFIFTTFNAEKAHAGMFSFIEDAFKSVVNAVGSVVGGALGAVTNLLSGESISQGWKCGANQGILNQTREWYEAKGCTYVGDLVASQITCPADRFYNGSSCVCNGELREIGGVCQRRCMGIDIGMGPDCWCELQEVKIEKIITEEEYAEFRKTPIGGKSMPNMSGAKYFICEIPQSPVVNIKFQ
jgi:hypothetical protein